MRLQVTSQGLLQVSANLGRMVSLRHHYSALHEIAMLFKSRRPKLGLIAVLVFIFASLAVETTALADDDPKEPTYPVEVLSIQTILVDANDQPIANAKATVNGMRCLEDPGSWYGWPSPNIGKVQDSQSGSNGKTDFRYPIKFGVPEKWLTTTTLDINFSHPDYVDKRMEIK